MAEAPATAIRSFFQEKGSFALSRFRFAKRNEANPNELISALQQQQLFASTRIAVGN